MKIAKSEVSEIEITEKNAEQLTVIGKFIYADQPGTATTVVSREFYDTTPQRDRDRAIKFLLDSAIDEWIKEKWGHGNEQERTTPA